MILRLKMWKKCKIFSMVAVCSLFKILVINKINKVRRLCRRTQKMKMNFYLIAIFFLFLFAAFGHGVSRAKTRQHGDAAAQWGIDVGISAMRVGQYDAA